MTVKLITLSVRYNVIIFLVSFFLLVFSPARAESHQQETGQTMDSHTSPMLSNITYRARDLTFSYTLFPQYTGTVP